MERYRAHPLFIQLVKILLVATRDLGGLQTGRKLVLKTILRSCIALGHEIDIAVIGPKVTGKRQIAVAGPHVWQVGANLAVHFLLGKKSLNECLYWSSSAQRRITALVAEGAYTLVIADMIRTAQFCSALPTPWVLDLDDLLSDRYARFTSEGDTKALLGYFSERLPSMVRWIAARAVRHCLALEARRIAAQELHFASRAHAVTLVSPVEARRLAIKLQRRVHDAAVSIDTVAPPPLPHAMRQRGAVAFIGGLEYQPNLDAIRHYLDNIAPQVKALGGDLALHVFGNAPAALRPSSPEGTWYAGYVNDLTSTIGNYSIFVAPILVEGGVKTKVLEAMASGLAVVASPQAVTGLNITPGEECFVTATDAEFASAVVRLAADPVLCSRMGQAAKAFVERNFSRAVLERKWEAVLHDATQNFNQARPS